MTRPRSTTGDTLPTTLYAQEPGRVMDAALFSILPEMSGLWSGPPILQEELGAWVRDLKYFRHIEVDPVLTLVTVSGNSFELYGKGNLYLNPVRLARVCCFAAQSDAPADNAETGRQAVEAWDRYVKAVSGRIGPPDETNIDQEHGVEAVWRRHGPTLRLWLNMGHTQVTGGELAVSALVRLDVHAPHETAPAATAAATEQVCDVQDWFTPDVVASALRRAWAEYEADFGEPELADRLAELHRGALECGGSVRGVLARIHEAPVPQLPDTKSFFWAHAYRHPEAPQGRLPAVHLATALADAVNERGEDRRAQVFDTTYLGAGLHSYALFEPDMQDALAITGREAAALWKKLRGAYAAAAVGEILYVAPPDVVREMQRQMSAQQPAGTA